MAFRFLRHFRAHQIAPSAASYAAATQVAAWSWLDPEGRDQLVADTDLLLRSFTWEPARGFELTDAICATIAAHAALLTLGLGMDSYRNVTSVIVHPSTIEMRGEHQVGGGIVANGTMDLLGQAHLRGPVLIAWDSALDQARHPERGHNVIFHEFAHHLDMLDGWIDGTPPLPTTELRARWIAVCTDEFERLRSGDTADGVLDGYGATDPGEFFAVITEVFFARPAALAALRPELYDVLSRYYLQDPAGLN